MANQLTLEILNHLNFKDVIYMEETSPGAMGNVGGVVLEVLGSSGLDRYETNLDTDPAARSAAVAKLKENLDLYDHHYGGYGNEVYVRKGVRILIDVPNGQFILRKEEDQYPFKSSVRGVFKSVAASMMRSLNGSD
jgi:hypothetical protein